MPQTVTFKTNIKFADGGPNIPDANRESKVSACLSLMEEVPADKNWTVFEIMAGDSQQIEFMMLAADKYKDQTCPRDDEPGLLFKFEEDSNTFFHLDGPLLYAGHTAACLPSEVARIWVQNRMTEKAKIFVLLGRKLKKKEKLAAAMKANGAVVPTPTAAQ